MEVRRKPNSNNLRPSKFGSSNSKLQSQVADTGSCQQVTSQPTSSPTATDKRMQELRALALEYVKQIVVKAGELAQERRSVKLANSRRLSVEQAAASFRDAASQINHRFQLYPNQQLESNRLLVSEPQISRIEEAQTRTKKPHETQLNETSKPTYKNEHKKEKRSHSSKNRINWALVMSCFSTCLPTNFRETMTTPSGDGGGTA